ncbi:TPR end-of-group domain-containing protein [Leptothrix ochracea]|uniref:TPR end-of-group domain-containing protein n=1 Tax=Leptothrix ochracea TaxID=735331 RepID=UPI0034E23AD3
MRKLLLLFLLTQSLAGAAAPLNAATQASSIVESNVSSKPEPAPQITPDQYKELSDRLRATEYAVLDGQRKIVDWWISALAILTGIIAFFGGFIPFLMGRKDKELLKIELQNAKNLVASIKTHEKEAKDLTVNLKGFVTGAEVTPEQTKSTQQDAGAIINDPNASEVDKLQARAVLASQHEKPTREQALKAFELWNALCLIREYDVSAHFNTGYWAQNLFEHSKSLEREKWFDILQKHYAQALAIKPDMHEAAYNWGVALYAEAQVIQAIDLPAARLLWSQAGQKYAQALAIKPDKHEAAINWGAALAAEAIAIQAIDLPAARLLWSQAGQKYAQALAIEADKYDAAFNWGVALNAEAVAIQATDLPTARLLWNQARQKYAQALAIKPDRYETVHKWGNALAFEAHAIQAEYPQEARKLWGDASEKYDLALRIKPDMHEAATMLGTSLIFLYQLTIPSKPAEADTYLNRAIELLQKHSATSREGRDEVAYNLACAYSLQGRAADAVAQLDICIEANKLAPHWRDEKDFEPIRHTPEFLAWVEKNFPETKAAPI